MKVLVEREMSEKPEKNGRYFIVLFGQGIVSKNYKDTAYFNYTRQQWSTLQHNIEYWYQEVEMPTAQEINQRANTGGQSTEYENAYVDGAQYILDKLKGK